MHATKILRNKGDYLATVCSNPGGPRLNTYNKSCVSNDHQNKQPQGYSVGNSGRVFDWWQLYESIGSNSLLEGMEYWETSLNSIQIHCLASSRWQTSRNIQARESQHGLSSVTDSRLTFQDSGTVEVGFVLFFNVPRFLFILSNRGYSSSTIPEVCCRLSIPCYYDVNPSFKLSRPWHLSKQPI